MVDIIHSTQIHLPNSDTLVYYTLLLASALHQVHATSTAQSQPSLDPDPDPSSSPEVGSGTAGEGAGGGESKIPEPEPTSPEPAVCSGAAGEGKGTAGANAGASGRQSRGLGSRSISTAALEYDVLIGGVRTRVAKPGSLAIRNEALRAKFDWAVGRTTQAHALLATRPYALIRSAAGQWRGGGGMAAWCAVQL